MNVRLKFYLFIYFFFGKLCQFVSTSIDEACQQIRCEVMTSIGADAFSASDSFNTNLKACILDLKTSLKITLNKTFAILFILEILCVFNVC